MKLSVSVKTGKNSEQLIDLGLSTAAEVQAAFGNVSIMTLYRWRKAGMPAYRIQQFPKLVLYDLDKCREWFAKKK